MSECEKKIKYQSRALRGSGSVSGILTIQDFETSVKVNRDPTEIAVVLDDYQYDRCKDAEKCSDRDPMKQYYLHKRDRAIDLLTSLRTVIIVHSNNKKILRRELVKSVKAIRIFLEIGDLELQRDIIYDKMKIKPQFNIERINFNKKTEPDTNELL